MNGRYSLKKIRPKIIVDDREPEKIIELLILEDIEIEVSRLEVGDYIISNKLAVERKTGHDFVSAVGDSRLFEQLIRLKENYEISILILENMSQIFEDRNIKISSVYGIMGYIASRLNISIIPTRNEKDTAILLKRLAIREQIKDDEPVIARRAPKSMSLKERQQFLLEGLFRTGPKRAKILLDHFKTPYGVFKAIAKTNLIYSNTGKIKYIEGPLKKIKGIGVKFVMENKKLLKEAGFHPDNFISDKFSDSKSND